MFLQDTEEQFMMVSNILAGNVSKNFPIRLILQNTEGQFMKESNFLVNNVAKNLPGRVI